MVTFGPDFKNWQLFYISWFLPSSLNICLLYKSDPGFRSTLEAVVLGEVHLTDETRTRVRTPVDRIFVHPGYQPIIIDNDIALIKLAEPVKFDYYVRPVCLPTNGTDF